MNLLRPLLLGGVIGSLFLLVFLNTQFGKNVMGNQLGFGTCPNCDDNWWWKEHNKGLIYKALAPDDIFIETSPGINIIGIYGSVGMMMCDECMEHPENLDEERIALSLTDSEWPENNIEAVRIALRQYRKENGIIEDIQM